MPITFDLGPKTQARPTSKYDKSKGENLLSAHHLRPGAQDSSLEKDLSAELGAKKRRDGSGQYLAAWQDDHPVAESLYCRATLWLSMPRNPEPLSLDRGSVSALPKPHPVGCQGCQGSGWMLGVCGVKDLGPKGLVDVYIYIYITFYYIILYTYIHTYISFQ